MEDKELFFYIQQQGFNPYSPGFSIYLVYLLDILIRSISSKLFDT